METTGIIPSAQAAPTGDPVKRCPRCGRTYPAEFGFCEDDAAPLADADGSSAPTAAGVAGFPRRLVLLGGAGVAAFAIVALVLAVARPHPAPDRYQSVGSQSVVGALGASGTAGTAAWRTYRNETLGFAMGVPANWGEPKVEDLGRSTGDGHMVHVTFRPVENVTALVAVDLDATGLDARAEWQDLDGRFRKVYKERYRRVSLEDGIVDGRAASTWRFVLQKKGQPLLERLDVGTMAGGRRHAFLFLAPPDRFPAWEPTFRRCIGSIRWSE